MSEKTTQTIAYIFLIMITIKFKKEICLIIKLDLQFKNKQFKFFMDTFKLKNGKISL